MNEKNMEPRFFQNQDRWNKIYIIIPMNGMGQDDLTFLATDEHKDAYPEQWAKFNQGQGSAPKSKSKSAKRPDDDMQEEPIG